MVPTPAAWLCPPWAQGCCPRGQALRRGRTGSTPLGKGFTFSSLSFPLVQDRPPGSCPWNAAAVRPEALDAFGISELSDTRTSLWPHSHQTQEDKEEPPEHGSPEPAEEQGAQGPGCWGSAVRGWGLDGAGQRGSPGPGAGGGGLSTPGRGPCSTAASEAACPGPARTGSPGRTAGSPGGFSAGRTVGVRGGSAPAPSAAPRSADPERAVVPVLGPRDGGSPKRGPEGRAWSRGTERGRGERGVHSGRKPRPAPSQGGRPPTADPELLRPRPAPAGFSRPTSAAWCTRAEWPPARRFRVRVE